MMPETKAEIRHRGTDVFGDPADSYCTNCFADPYAGNDDGFKVTPNQCPQCGSALVLTDIIADPA